jgi:hypothetical protein
MKNEGLVDRILRIIFGIGIFLLGIYYSENGWQYLFYLLGIILIITGITGYCGIYNLFKFSTVRKKKFKKKFIGAKKDTGM